MLPLRRMPAVLKAIRLTPWGKLFAFACALACATDASAINFVLNYRGPGTASPDPDATTNPNDPTGALLTAHMQVAADDWADLVEDAFTMDINFHYAAVTSLANAAVDIPTAGFTRTREGTIQFSDSASFWFDPTPTLDTEFDLSQTILGDLPAQDQADYFIQGSGNTSVLEVGYRGSSNGSDAGATNGTDVLSVARHEIGHLMGVTGQLTGNLGEFSDFDYDMPPFLVAGANVGAVFVGALTPEDDDVAHLEATTALMTPFIAPGMRNDISATDVFAAARASNWTQIDLKRIDYMSNNLDFATAAHWEGNRVPGATDQVFIRHGGVVTLSANDVVGSLLVAGGSGLSTFANTLFVQGTATIGEAGGSNSTTVTANAGGTFAAGNIVIEAGEAQLAGGQITSQGDITNNATIRGSGTILLLDDFANNGSLSASGGSTLIVDELIAGAGATVDLDGSGGGRVFAIGGSLDVNVDNSPFFGGTMNIGAGRFVDLPNNWQLSFGDLLLNGSGTQAAELRGGDLAVSGEVIVDRQGLLDVHVVLNNNGSSEVPDANDELTFGQSTTYDGGNHTGMGSHVYNGDVQFNDGNLTVGSITHGNSSVDTVIAGGTVNVETIDATSGTFVQSGGTLSFEQFDGRIGQTGGTMALDQATINGTIQQTSQGTLAIEIGGTDRGEFSFIDVVQDAELAGELSVSLAGGYTPGGGELFTVLTADNLIAGGLTLAGPAAGMFQIFIGSSSIVLQALAPTIAGDFNGDGTVDAADYVVWRKTDGSPAGYAAWRENFGQTAGSGSALLSGSAVPEPASAVLLVGVVIALGARRRRLANST